MSLRPRIPATIVTGFLGAGKTTLIRHLLRNADGRRLALIINEFGDLGVDGELLLGCGDEACAEDDIIELANGCICCTVADDFLPTMQKLLDRPEPPDHIVIETSGLALPKPLVQGVRLARGAHARDGRRRGRGGRRAGGGRAAASPTTRGGGAGSAGRSRARPRQPAGGGVRGPARLRRPDRAQQDRPSSTRDALGARRAAIWPGAAAAGRRSWCRPAHGAARSAVAARARRGGRGRSRRRRQSHHERGGRARPRRFRQLRRRARAGGRPGRRCARALRAADRARTTCCASRASSTCPARPCARSCRRVGAAHRAATSTAPGGRRAPREPAGGDRPEGPRPRRDRRRALGAASDADASARRQARDGSPTAARRSISARRRATSSCCRRRQRARLLGRGPRAPLAERAAARACASQPACGSAHPLLGRSLCREVVAQARLVVRAAARRPRLLALRRRAARRDLPRARHRAGLAARRRPAGRRS